MSFTFLDDDAGAGAAVRLPGGGGGEKGGERGRVGVCWGVFGGVGDDF